MVFWSKTNETEDERERETHTHKQTDRRRDQTDRQIEPDIYYTGIINFR